METTQVRLLDYGDVVRGLKAGRKFARQGWNGKGLYVQLHGSVPAVTLTGDPKFLDKFFVIVNGERVNTWVASVSDTLAEDWFEVL